MFYIMFSKAISIYLRIFYKVKINGLGNIPGDGRLVICSNHRGLTDPLLLAAIIPRKLNYMAKKELFDNSLLGFFIKKLGAFPVDRETSGLSSIKAAIKILKDDKVFAMFPQGTRVVDEGNEDVKPGIAMISIKGRSPIIPIHIDTQYELFKEIRVNIGKPMFFDKYFDRKVSSDEYKTLSKQVLKEIYKLKSS